jgi:hypothetical protein
MRPGWLDLVDRTEGVPAVYGEETPPQLSAVVVHGVEFAWPAVRLTFALPAFPAHPPARWVARGSDTVRLTIDLAETQDVELAGWDADVTGEVDLARAGDRIAVSLASPAASFTCTARFVGLLEMVAVRSTPRPQKPPQRPPQQQPPPRPRAAAGSWLDLVEGGDAVTDLYGDEAASLLGPAVLHSIRLDPGASTVRIGLDLRSLPAEPPPEWVRLGYNCAYLGVQLSGVRDVRLRGWQLDVVGDLELRRDGDRVAVSWDTPAVAFRCTAAAVRVTAVTGGIVGDSW